MKRLYTLFAALVFLVAAPFATAQAFDQVYTSTFSSKAISGYDTVAYFTEGKPVKGSSKFSTEWRGAKWQFASAENLALFKADPEKYAPQYGGYCAWAVSQGTEAPGDPDNWAIDNGKLYLNYNANVQKRWNADRANFIKDADAKWPTLVKPASSKKKSSPSYN